MKISVIVGVGFGDEGKGATVNALSTNPEETIVVRFNGGHQVGHTVVNNDVKHIFSNFGSGTLKGVSTYWSEYCTVNPMAVQLEGDALRNIGVTPKVYYDANVMVTTPYDIYRNISDRMTIENGSVGVGFGATIQRNEDNYRLFIRDLKYPSIRDAKLDLIKQYYEKICESKIFLNSDAMCKVVEDFKSSCDDLVNKYNIINESSSLMTYGFSHVIFEGGQGIMLDMDYGFFPNVTRSNTTSKNAMKLIKKWGLSENTINTYYITRAYQTRHGNGFLLNENLDNSRIKINPNESNLNTGTQGIFRRSILDLNQLQYAISCDEVDNLKSNKNLVITCLDHVDGIIPITIDSKIHTLKPDELGSMLDINHVLCSYSDKGI